MTIDELENLCGKWQVDMGLNDWVIYLESVDSVGVDAGDLLPAIARVEIEYAHMQAYIQVRADTIEPYSLLHELCHLLIADITRAAEVIGNGDPIYDILLRDAVEKTTERLTRVFWHKLGGKDDTG